MCSLIDRFIPQADVQTRHEILVRAPPPVVLEVARGFDMHSIPVVRAIFWLRGRLLGANASRPDNPAGLVAETLAMGWGVLADEPGRIFIAGAACRPWEADVTFLPIPPEEFAAWSEPDRVKIVWTLEAHPATADSTRFATETRVQATDDRARARFRRYWRRFGIGIRMIRWLLLRSLRREAERRWRATGGASASKRR